MLSWPLSVIHLKGNRKEKTTEVVIMANTLPLELLQLLVLFILRHPQSSHFSEPIRHLLFCKISRKWVCQGMVLWFFKKWNINIYKLCTVFWWWKWLSLEPLSLVTKIKQGESSIQSSNRWHSIWLLWQFPWQQLGDDNIKMKLNNIKCVPESYYWLSVSGFLYPNSLPNWCCFPCLNPIMLPQHIVFTFLLWW